MSFTGHTRTSLLRTLNSQGKFNSDEWLLPETRQLFEKQATRQKKLAQGILSYNVFLSRLTSISLLTTGTCIKKQV
jgi:hypothetical protein